MRRFVHFARSAGATVALFAGTTLPGTAQRPGSPPQRTQPIDASVHLASVEQAVKQLGQLIANAGEGTATAADQEHTRWLAEVQSRLESHVTGLKQILQTQVRQAAGAAPSADAAKMAQMNMQFREFQDALIKESTRFQALSNLAKTRHDAAMSAIRNIK